jgi:RNA-directed DNA polymerase
VVEADVRACFDELGHTPILGRLRHRTKDKRVVALVRAFLKTGVMTTLGDREETPAGTPQGAVLSPLLVSPCPLWTTTS